MASTVLGGLTSALGITLPFAVYMGMSQMIALAIGPVGWLALFWRVGFYPESAQLAASDPGGDLCFDDSIYST